MLKHPTKQWRLILTALTFLCLHFACSMAFRSHAMAVTYLFFISAPLAALFVCYWRLRRSSTDDRLPWALFSAGLALWNCGMLLSAKEDLFQHSGFSVATYSDFFYFLYGVPILLAISLPLKSQRFPLFVWFDGLQALLTGCLAYIAIFSVVPFSQRTAPAITASLLVTTYNVENFALAACAAVRLLASSKKGDEHSFYKILCAFLCVYAISAGIYNYAALAAGGGHSLTDLLVDVPFLALAVIALRSSSETAETQPDIQKRPLALFIGNASPVFFTLAPLALGIFVLRQHFNIGITAIVIALAAYAVRTTILQGRYIQSQQSLQQARDRLEELSLKDALTNIANRRFFDQMLALEWNRALRMQHPLALLLIDIDYFKALNDSFGHLFGDRCLSEISAALSAALPRSGDFLARYGGEEFAAILPATCADGAKEVADRMHEAIRSLQIKNGLSNESIVTISIGIAVQHPSTAGSASMLIETSDRALYKAKQNGRNRSELLPVSS